MKTIFLTGAPASGKTTLGEKLAAALKAKFVDLDERIVQNDGRTIPEIFAEDGETGFRKAEKTALLKLTTEIAEVKGDWVIALGGGTLLDNSNRELCNQIGSIFCLDAPNAEELNRRILAAGKTRPLGNKAAERAVHYAEFNSRIASFFEVPGSLVIVGSKIAEVLVGGLPLVVDDNVTIKGNKIAAIKSPTEINKNLTSITQLWQSFARTGLGRKDVVVAVGGGVTGDLTGFAAATWMRGIDWINVPTTLLSMIDASTGGKTGCDLPEGKNLVGAFHAPRLVIIDTEFLKTLPEAELIAGKAEMVKHTIIAGKGEVGWGVPTAAMIAENLSVKAEIVRADPFETKDKRVLLNAGHTIAHALEVKTNFALSHGRAVAIGLVAEAELAVKLGLAEASWPKRIADMLSALNLPTAMPEGISFESLIPIMIADKKREGKVVKFALPCNDSEVKVVPITLG